MTVVAGMSITITNAAAAIITTENAAVVMTIINITMSMRGMDMKKMTALRLC